MNCHYQYRYFIVFSETLLRLDLKIIILTLISISYCDLL